MHLHKEMLRCKIAKFKDKSICKTQALLMHSMHEFGLACQILSADAENTGGNDRFVPRKGKFHHSE